MEEAGVAYAVLIKLINRFKRQARFDSGGNVLRQFLPFAASYSVYGIISSWRHNAPLMRGAVAHKRTALPR